MSAHCMSVMALSAEYKQMRTRLLEDEELMKLFLVRIERSNEHSLSFPAVNLELLIAFQNTKNSIALYRIHTNTFAL